MAICPEIVAKLAYFLTICSKREDKWQILITELKIIKNDRIFPFPDATIPAPCHGG